MENLNVYELMHRPQQASTALLFLFSQAVRAAARFLFADCFFLSAEPNRNAVLRTKNL
jgi:hypothetical protein